MGNGQLMPGKPNEEDIGQDVYCFPLYSLMLALNRTRIDYFSLDVEGFEMPILSSIPFKKLDIHVITVEYYNIKEGEKRLKEFMESQGYRMHSKIYHQQSAVSFGADDPVFQRYNAFTG